MDRTSIAGIGLGLLAIILGQALEGGHLASLLQPTAFVIVMGGTIGAVMLQCPLPVFMEGVRMAAWVFRPPLLNPMDTIAQVVSWSYTARRDGLLVLEGVAQQLSDPFAAKGLQLLVDGVDPDDLQEGMEPELEAYEEHLRLCAKVWEAAGGYAPTIGILGAVMGLIHVMENLSDPSKLGGGIAVAFVATIYGVGSANLIFLPMAKKIMVHVGHRIRLREMLLDGLVGIARGENPRVIESRLQGYFPKLS